MFERGSSRRWGPAEVLVVVFVCLFLLALAPVACRKSRFESFRARCAMNLSLIGKAMLDYANDYDDQFPRSSGRNAMWSQAIFNWQASDRFQAFGMARDGSGGCGTISSCFYLLVKYEGAAPGTFVCPGDGGMTVFDPAGAGAGDKELIDLWDFGPDASNHCSYAYHMPFGLYALTTSNLPGMAVAADRNPWLSSAARQARDFARFNPDGGREAIKIGNAVAHENEGQNVLFVDGHVAFETQSFCGLNKDNIYTWWDGGDVRRGGKPMLWTEPKGRRDSYLVNESPVYRATMTMQPKDVNSADLKQTAIVATLDCPMPEHKNVIWCGTFQIAWDKFKNDIIKEPVELINAENLAERLNRGEFSPENLEAESFYATAGFVEDGILEEIQEEMAKRFPSEPRLVFDKRYRELEQASIAYCFLDLNTGFKYPFYATNYAFAFADSSGTRSSVTSFSVHIPVPDQDSDRVREQVEILYDNYRIGTSLSTAEFVIDLCKHTAPYQVVLACVPRRDTLSETLAAVEEKISSFKQDPRYDSRCKLHPMDELIVPDILYKLTHHFRELEWKRLANPKWRAIGYFIFEARQMVQFSLNRTGLIVKSEARIGGAGALPRCLYFNRPFLIYVKKRGAEFSPFFVMWVDNAELMNKF